MIRFANSKGCALTANHTVGAGQPAGGAVTMQVLTDVRVVVDQGDDGLFRFETCYTYEDGSTAIRECLLRKGGPIAIPPDAREGTVMEPRLVIVGHQPPKRGPIPEGKPGEELKL